MTDAQNMPDAEPEPAGKVPPESLELRSKPRPVARINRRILVGVIGFGLLLIAGLVLVALQGRASFDVTVYFALAQIPMYTLPALLKPVYARLTAARAPPR